MTPHELYFHAQFKKELLMHLFNQLTKEMNALDKEILEFDSQDIDDLCQHEQNVTKSDCIKDHLEKINDDLDFYTSFLETYGEQIISDLNPSSNSLN